MKRLLLVLLALLLCVGALSCTPQEPEEPTPDTFLGQEWYLAQKPIGTPTIPELTAEQENVYIQLPKEYSQTIDGVTLQLEFLRNATAWTSSSSFGSRYGTTQNERCALNRNHPLVMLSRVRSCGRTAHF